MGKLVRLANRAVVAVSGEEAQDFLQGIITNRIDRLEAGKGVYAGLLTPQGKLLFDFFICRDEGRFLFDVFADLAADLVKRLTFYKLRAKVEIEHLADAGVGAAWGDDISLPTGAIAYEDPRFEKMGTRFILTSGIDELPDDDASWLAHRLALGLPEGGVDYAYGDGFPHDIAMDQLHGIDFNKGCYVGQEVVSRMRHRGTARKRPMLISAADDLPEAPAPVIADGVTVGEMRSSAGGRGLAEIRIDRAESALEKAAEFSIGGKPVSLLRPIWSDYAEAFPPS